MQSDFSITGFASGALPTVGESGWGTILNNYLSQEHTVEGGHSNITSTNWTNVTVTSSQITNFNESVWELAGNGTLMLTSNWNSTNSSYRTLDNLTFEGDVNVSGNLNVTGNLTVNGNISQSETPDANTLYAKSLPKAWVNFDGTDSSSCTGTPKLCTIRDSFNVDNVTRNSVGDYTIFWDRDFANINYVVIGTSHSIIAADVRVVNEVFTSRTSGSTRINIIREIAGSDNQLISLVAFGEQ